MRYMKKVGTPVDMENLPCDVLPNIFIRLIAKQVAQMRCVCKFWNALLSGSSFVKSHLHHSIHNNDEILLFFLIRDPMDSDQHHPSTARPSRSPDIELTNFMKLKLPIDPQHKKAWGEVIGSVNGLICFFYLLYPGLVVRIWNPSLSASLTLPPPSLSLNGTTLRFGFDPKADDYKVVKLASDFREPHMVSQPQGEVYSMRKGSWESISQRIPSHIKQFMSHNRVCIDGHLHWLCKTDSKWKPQTIVTFDLGAMTYGEIPLPDSIRHQCLNELGVLGGKLCVMSPLTYGRIKYDVWIMDGDESWVKRHVFSQFKCVITPYGFTSRKEFLFRVNDDCRFALYDPISDKTKIFKIKGTRRLDRYKVTEYVDSLVWIAPASQFKLAA